MIWFYDSVSSIRDFLELGGDVLYGIMATLFLMWTFILERLWYFYRVHPGLKRRIIHSWEERADTTSWYAKRIREQMISETSVALKRNVSLIKALIAICPLLGLAVAIPLTLLHSFLQGKSKALIKVLEEQAAGIVARLAEQRG